MCRRFQKTTHYTLHALHATACLDQHLITISSPTVLHNHWMSLQPCGHPSPACRVSLSLCLSVRVCGHLLHAPAEHGKTPAWRPVLSTQLWPPGGSIDITKLNASRRTLTHTSHNWPTSWGTLPMSWLGIKLLHHRRLSPTLLSLRVEFSGPRRSCLATLLPIFSSRVCIRGRSYVQGNNRRGCD